MLFVVAGALSAAAQAYVSEVCISSHKQRMQAIMQAQMAGWEVIDGDLNWDAGGDYIFLCVKRSNSIDDAITDMVIMNGSDYKYNSGRTVKVDGLIYRPAELIDEHPSSLAGDLNKDAGGSDLFLYITREKKSGETPHFITNLKVRDGGNSRDDKLVREGNNNGGKGDAMDCNKRAGGRYVYIEMYKEEAPKIGDIEELKQAFNVYRGGGGLYQIDVPLLFRKDDGASYLVGGGTFSGDPCNIVQYLPAGADGSVESNWKVAFKTKTKVRDDGRLYDAARPCEWIPGDGMLRSIKSMGYISQTKMEEQNHGNEENMKYGSVYWYAPRDVNVARFRLVSKGCTVGQTNYNTLNASFEKEDVTMEAPEGMNVISIIDPMLNLINSDADMPIVLPGSQILQIQTANRMQHISLWDATTGAMVPGSEVYPGPETRSFKFNLNHYEEEHNLAVLAYGEERVQNTDGTIPVLERGYMLPVVLHPFHSIDSCWVEQQDSIDERGVFGATNIVRWTVPNVRVEDVMSGDEFIVQRAYKADFSDAINIGNLPVGTMVGDDLTIDHDTNKGTFMLEDFDEKGWYNALDSLPDAKIYYRVFRAMVYARWGEGSMSDFCKSASVASDNYLANIDRVTVSKTQHFETEKMVKVRVELPINVTPRRYWYETANIVIERFSPAHEHYEGRDYAKKTIVINGDDVKYDKDKGIYYVEVEDIQGAPYLHYFYTAKVEHSNCPYPMLSNDAVTTSQTDANLCFSETLAPIKAFTASRGTVKGMVALEWESDEGLVDYYRLERRPYGSKSEADYKTLKLKSPLTASYIDEEAASAQVYEYRVTAGVNLYGKTHERSTVTYGWNPYFGTLRGSVRMNNGALLPGKVTVSVKSVKTEGDATPALVSIPEVRDVENDSIIVPSYNSIYERAVTTDNGTFEFDDIPYSGTTRYQIEVNASGSDFVRKGQEDAEAGKLFFVSLDDTLIDPQVDLICKSTRTFSGRVLYNSSTIPVRDCQFLMNGSPVLNADGTPLTTDSKGNFSFELPIIKMDLQVVKDGHTFLEDGKVKGRTADLSMEDDSALGKFTPSADYPGLLLYDDTKVRLIGRLTGGEQQGRKPLGFGLSTNNLGDHLKMVLELEGDPTAQIVYDNEHPDKTTREEQFTQHNYLTDEQGRELSSKEVSPTRVSFEKKRIIVSPDEETGEFCLDLVPTKYKVTELSADGYSTLFRAGEGFHVLDLSQCVTMKTDTLGLLEGMNLSDFHQTQYHATYQCVHHNPVEVTLTQYEMGQPREYYGAKELSEMNLKGETVKLSLFSLTEKKDSVKYVFGYPVFAEGKTYDIQVSAHEDYYYNGNMQLQPDVVYLEGGLLKVRNGLVGNESETQLALGKDGKAMISFLAANPTFSDTGKDALRSIRVQIENNGYFYENKELLAYVTGSRKKGNDVITVDNDITLLDVIRDPYGSRSYAYREAGTKYHWAHNWSLNISGSIDIDLKQGTQGQYFTGLWGGIASGAVGGNISGAETTWDIKTSFPLLDYTYISMTEYDMTLNTRIETSSDPLDVGAMADVYIGTVNTTDISRVETFSVIDQDTYDLVRPGIETGAIRVVSEGKNDKGTPYYLVISDKIGITQGKPREFIYTQKHIVNVLIPNLDQMASSKILDCTEEEAKILAVQSGETKYIWKKNADNVDEIVAVFPTEDEDKNKVETFTPGNLWNSMLQWGVVVAANEQTKCAAMQAGSKEDKSYSVTASSKVDHSEGAEWYEKTQWDATTLNFDWNKMSFKGISLGATRYLDEKKDEKNQKKKELNWLTSFYIGGSKWVLDLQPLNPSFDYQNDLSSLVTYSGGSGYVIETNDNSYLDINVHAVSPYIFENSFTQEQLDWVKTNTSRFPAAAELHEWVYTVKGGAERQPWYEPDSTLFYHRGTPLTARTLRIDNPRIYIDNPVVSNVPSGEKAIFKVRLANETELSTRPEGLNPSKFALFLDDEFCPDGAAITMDGQPIADGREFYLDPGQSITKTIAVERCGKTYDYENMRLGFMDDAMSLIDYATLSVHFLPSSTPVNMVMPADKWVLNTLSAVDEQGRYYLPIEVNGYDVNYENFDHIEVQYKKHTDGDSKWVNLCSYYSDKELYEKASGEKAMLGKISLRFYGDADPVEMQYDLRAVSFCRLGNGFVTKSSEVVTGTKDTRAPEVFGVPKPSNGILTFEDVISVPFSEPIAYNYLDETANFQVVGYTNDSETTYETALAFYDENDSDSDDAVPTSKIKRNLSGRDFTISAVTRLTSESDQATFMMIRDHDVLVGNDVSDYTLDFCYRDGRLLAYINSIVFVSQSIYESPLAEKNLSLRGKMTSVAMTYRRPENTPEGEPQVRFYLDGVELPLATVSLLRSATDVPDLEAGSYEGPVECNVYGHVEVGESTMNGRMANVRLWDKVLPVNELMGKMNKRLNGSEPGLLGYWPMDEMAGNVLYDKAHGADLHFKYQTWVLPEGQHSLRLSGDAIRLQNTVPFARQEYEDYTLGFWMQPQTLDSQMTEDGTVNVLQAGANDAADRFRLYFDKGDFKIQSGKNVFTVCSQQDVADGKWHNVSVVANKSMNTCTAYVDGLPTLTVNGTDLGGLQETIYLGGRGFYGNFDNLSFWHLAFPANNLSMIYNYAPTGQEMGLAYFLPFEMDKRNAQNTWESVFCPYNMVNRYKEDGTECEKELAIDGDDVALQQMDNNKSYPAVRSLSGITNIPFSWTSNGNELQINLKQRDADINHQQIFVTVRGVEDLAGNTMANPLMMSMYLDRNVLVWEDSKLDIAIPYGMEEEIWAQWTNKSGRSMAYSIESNNTWLEPSTTMGMAQPMAKEPITIHVSGNLPPGKYTGIIYLIDENNLSSPLTINLTVEAMEPDWTVTDLKGYSLQMGLVARVKVKTAAGSEYYDMDNRDQVACFDKTGHCVGRAGITVDNKRNTASVNMTIYGTTAMNADRQELSFRLWRASTNEVYFLRQQNGEPIFFEHTKLMGCPPDEPITLVTYDQKVQNIALERGWNWVSFNVKPGEHNLAGLFSSNEMFEQGDYVMFTTRNGVRTAEYSEFLGKGSWSNSQIFNADRTTMNIYVSHPCVISVAGSEYTDADRYVPLTNSAGKEGTWNDLPYLLTVDQPVNVALSDLASISLMDGTIVKSRKEFAVIDRSTNTWVGSLQTMHPGMGYYIRYYNDDTRMKYTNTNVSAKAPKKGRRADGAESEDSATLDLSLVQGGEHMTSMPVIAQVESSAEWLEGDAIVAYAGGELTGAATLTEMPDGRWLAFLTVNAEQGSDIHFAHVRGDKVMAKSRATLDYDADGVTGTLDQPYLISFAGEDGADGIYDLAGIRYSSTKSLTNRPGVLIINGKKELKK